MPRFSGGLRSGRRPGTPSPEGAPLAQAPPPPDARENARSALAEPPGCSLWKPQLGRELPKLGNPTLPASAAQGAPEPPRCNHSKSQLECGLLCHKATQPCPHPRRKVLGLHPLLGGGD